MKLDVLCMGRAAVDLYAEQVGVPLERVTSFAKYMGGCAGNIAVGAARLGLRAGMLTRVGDDGLGRFVRDFLAAERVDVSGVRLDKAHRTGLAILGIQPPDQFELVFYRDACADIQLVPDDVDNSPVRDAGALVVTGTGLSREPSRSTTHHAIAIARSAGARIVLDLDVRPMLWDGGASENQRELQRVLPLADAIVGTEEEFAVAAGRSAGAVESIRGAAGSVRIVKRGSRGASAYPWDGAPVHAPGFRVEVLNTLGAGDGFMAGFLRGWLRGDSLADSLRLGNAVGAIVVTRHACAPAMPTLEEAQGFARTAEVAA